MCEIISNANDLAESNNTWRPSNWKKSSSKSYYPNPQPGQFLVLILKMIRPKTTSCFGCRKNIRTLQIQPQMGLYEGSRCLVVIVGGAQSVMHKVSMVLCSMRQIYEIFILMSMKDAFFVLLHTLTVECSKFTTSKNSFYHNSKWIFLYRFGFKRITFFSKTS